MTPDPRPMLVAVVGATGTGKSAFALDLAEAITREGGSAEIVNADAMQLYRGMDIGTAKLPVVDRRGIPHHLLDVLDVTDEASVAQYQVLALAAIADIESRGSQPILVGGSGLYVSAVLWDFRFPARDPAVRARLEAELDERGVNVMFARLGDLDPESAASIGGANARRIIRALEVIELTGAPFGAGLPDTSVARRPTAVVGLRLPREQLVARLDERVQGMWRDGLVEEVEGLLPRGLERGVTASRAIGYSQAIAQLRGRSTAEEAVADTQSLTRRYARRQVGWFRRYPEVDWHEPGEPAAVERVLSRIRPSMGT